MAGFGLLSRGSVGLEEWERVYVVAGFIVLVGLALRYFLAGDEENTIE